MWECEYSIETTAAPEAVWRLFADVERWPLWNAGVEAIEIDGPFQAGSVILMTPPGEEPIPMRLAEARENELFVDETPWEDVVVRVAHRLERIADGRTRVTYHMQIIGPSADVTGPEIGPVISGDFPDVLAALARRAEAG